jgi:protein-export membrane protein SecD
MNSAWRWKAGASLLAVLIAVWFVLPNLYDEPESKEAAAKRPWYEKILPGSRVRLGLDLQGGINMVLGVDLRRALMNEADRHVRDLKDYLPKEKIQYDTIEREFDSTQIKVKLKSPEDQSAFEKYLTSNFPTVAVAEHNAKEAVYALDINQDKKADVEKQTIDQALETLRSRLDEFGVSEPSIQARGNDQIIIQLPGMDDPKRASSVLGRTAQLEFKIVDDESVEGSRLDLMVQEAKTGLPKTFKIEDLNRALRGKIPSGTQVLFKEDRDSTTGQVLQTPYLLKAEARITGDMLEDARIGVDENNLPTVNLVFNARGTTLVDEVTGQSLGKRLAIILDDKVQSDPVIRARISNGRPQITFGALRSRQEIYDEAKDLSLVLRAGALPAPVEILQNSAVGPSLGRDSIEKGMRAMLIGVALVILFMAFYYRLSGVAADIAVLVNVIFTFACLGALHATLTLPGIAGIIISVGMAVDANVIIYERIREELKAGKPIKAAIEAGYDRAHLTIIDSNLTTIITALVLLQYGTGPIKGFAITLIFGLIANYFTALWFTRLTYEWVITKFQPARLSI